MRNILVCMFIAAVLGFMSVEGFSPERDVAMDLNSSAGDCVHPIHIRGLTKIQIAAVQGNARTQASTTTTTESSAA